MAHNARGVFGCPRDVAMLRNRFVEPREIGADISGVDRGVGLQHAGAFKDGSETRDIVFYGGEAHHRFEGRHFIDGEVFDESEI